MGTGPGAAKIRASSTATRAAWSLSPPAAEPATSRPRSAELTPSSGIGSGPGTGDSSVLRFSATGASASLADQRKIADQALHRITLEHPLLTGHDLELIERAGLQLRHE